MTLDIDKYLSRINYKGSRQPTHLTLTALQTAHLLAVPFENLDIHMKRPILLNRDKIYKKIVDNQRGGFCYELNGVFALLLEALGFDVTLLTARVVNSEGQLGHEFDHLTLMIRLDGQRWLIDVGFGYSFDAPLDIDSVFEQNHGKNAYQWEKEGPHIMLRINENGQGWQNRYRFSLEPQTYEAFAPGCHYHQTSPKSSFTQGRVCTLAKPNGRITLTDKKWIVTTNGEKVETVVNSENQFQNLLKQHFGIT